MFDPENREQEAGYEVVAENRIKFAILTVLLTRRLPTARSRSVPDGPPIKPGTSGGPTAGDRFPQSVRDEAFEENPTSTCVYCRREGNSG